MDKTPRTNAALHSLRDATDHVGYCAMTDLARTLERELAERDRRIAVLVGALTEIKTKYGKVCTGFELCQHQSCASSYGAWAVANAALQGNSGKGEGDG
jgi:hypothetical protein